ncbi:hypothetical protein [Deinococcus hohokamensis]|uniref:Uncharacterized protein n=1 Tax=Deinococcus hohokamensis TaxID=309883 RepID=A0ABV9IDD7_9DEIO
MRLTLPKRFQSVETPAPRTERSRLEDQFECDLREALQATPYDVENNVLLDNFVALPILPGTKAGVLSRETRKRVHFLIRTRQSHLPVAAILLTTQAYGRDRRQFTVQLTTPVQGQAIIPVLHLDPRRLRGASAVAEILQPHL